jgi:glycosyltransferase involved in cell wall biosynthesis
MRVLKIVEATSAGVGRHAIDVMRGLLRASCEVHLLYSPTRIDGAFERGLEQLPELRSAALEMRRAPHPGDALVVSSVLRYQRQHGPFDVVHGHSSKGGAIARLAALLTGTPAVYTPHCISTMAPGLSRATRRALGWTELLLSSVTSKIIAVSEEEREHLLELGVPAAQVTLIRHGVERLEASSQPMVRGSLGLPADATVIGFVGRLSEQKNPELLIRAFSDLSATRPALRLAVVGNGELEARCRALTGALRLDSRVHFLGYRAGYPCMPAFDVLAMPSRYEAAPYVLLEAIATGLPVVATAVGGTRSVIDDGENGFVVPSGDREAFARALAKLVDSAELRARFSQQARVRSAEFDLDRMVSHTLQVYRSCARGARRRTGAQEPSATGTA